MSDTFKIVIGNRAYSSWSLRGWLALAHTGAPFEEILLPLDTEEFRRRIGEYSPSRRVPVLIHGTLHIWDSLAIAEYLAEVFPEAGYWPANRSLRAYARSIACEMHAGFAALRRTLPMNCRAEGRRVALDAETKRDIARICDIWRTCRDQAGDGPWLLGRFGVRPRTRAGRCRSG